MGSNSQQLPHRNAFSISSQGKSHQLILGSKVSKRWILRKRTLGRSKQTLGTGVLTKIQTMERVVIRKMRISRLSVLKRLISGTLS